MDDKNAFLKGGKNGVVLNTANAEKGELWKRIILPESDDDHMPPKGKPQLTENEMALLHWWMKNGSPFDKRVNEFSQEGKDKEMLVSFEGETDRPLYNTDIPEEPVAAADDRLLKALRASGIVVLPVAQNSNYLEVVFPYGNKVRTGTMDSILMIRDQLVSFKAGGTILPEEDVQKLKACKSLIKLEMQYTGISDAGLQFIKELRALRYLNLSGTPVTESGISALKELRNIKKIYLYQTKVNRSNWKELQQAFPEAQLDSGGYIVPLFTSDTTVVQKPPEKD